MKCLIASILLLGTAWAQLAWEDPELQARLERAREDFRAERYEAARPSLRALSRAFPERLSLRYDWARCLVGLGRQAEARAAWEELLADHPDHGLAQIQLALLLMRTPGYGPEDVQRARHCLWVAAQFGYDALGLLDSESALEPLRHDVAFVLELVSAPAQRNQAFDGKPRHDPFGELLVRADAPPDEPPPPVEPPLEPGLAQLRLLERLEGLIAALDAALLEEQPERALEIFATVDAALASLQNIEDPELRGRVRALLERYDRLAVLVSELRVRRLDSKLLAQLASLEGAVVSADLACARAARAELLRLVGEVDPADASLVRVLEIRAAALKRAYELVAELGEISSLQLQLSGIVVGRDGERAVAQAIINQRIHRQSDTVLGLDGRLIPGLQVAAIDAQGVRFALRRLEFSLYLGLDDQVRSIRVLR